MITCNKCGREFHSTTISGRQHFYDAVYHTCTHEKHATPQPLITAREAIFCAIMLVIYALAVWYILTHPSF